VGILLKEIPSFIWLIKFGKIPGVQRALQMLSSLHGADWLFHRDQDQGAPKLHLSGYCG
jgi:hypothetical protein